MDKEKRVEIQRRYRERNREKLNEKNREYRKNNKEKVKETCNNWDERNWDKKLERAKKYRDSNGDSCRQRNREWYTQNKSRVRGRTLKRKYGITLDDFNRMLASQGGHCALCPSLPEDQKNGTLVVDHCHSTGKIRGLLCNPCNTAIGLFRESKETLKKAIDYLTVAETGTISTNKQGNTLECLQPPCNGAQNVD